MMSRHSLLLCASSFPSSHLKPLIAPYFCNSIKEYSQQHKGGEGEGEEKEELMTEMERAQSTAEVMKKLSQDKEEKVRNMEIKSQQGFVSHTSDKLSDDAKEAVGGDSDGGDGPEAVRGKYKEGGHGETYHHDD